MESIVIGVIALFALLVLIVGGVDVAVAMAAVGFVGLSVITNLQATLSAIAHSFYATASGYMLTVLPLFIIMGYFAAPSGIVPKAYTFAYRWLSNVRGGLYLVTVASCALFAAATGSSFAGTVAVGKSVLPEMKRLGYNRRLSVGCVASAGTMGVLIPPSIALVLYGIVTEESIGRLLIAGVIPGVVTAIIYMLGMALLVTFNPTLAPPPTKYEWKERFQSIPGVWGVALLAGIILGGIYSGVFTPTEAGGVGAITTLVLLALGTKKHFFSEAKKAAAESVLTNAMIFFLIVAAAIFSRFLTLCGAIDAIIAFIRGGEFSPLTILTFFGAIWIGMGMFMSATAALLLTAPIAHVVLVPLGFDGIWLGIIMVKMFELAAITPPVGLNVYVAKSLVPEMLVEDIFRGIIPFAIMDIITIVLLIAFPQIITWLPTMAFG